jgi:predicted Fe-Mo cluster-binding NifX family protein
MDLKNAAIAIATDDGKTVSSHFGRAQLYEVIKFNDGRVTERQRREKAGHHTFSSQESDEEHETEESHNRRHRAMVSSIPDCQAVVVRGMGQGAVDHLQRANLLPILTDLRTIDEVISAIASGSLQSDSRRIHQHHGH